MTQHINRQDQAIRRRAAILSVVMHVFLLAAMIFMVDWKDAHVNPSVMEATLWDSLPSKAPPEPATKPPEPTPPPPPPPVSEPPPKPEPEPPKKVTPPEPQVNQAEQEAEIALKKLEEEKKRKLEDEKKEEEKKKQEEKLNKIQEALRKQEEEDKLKKIQEAMRQQDLAAQQAAASATVDPSVLGYYVKLMERKIRGTVNPGLCPVTNPELLVDMQLTPAGDISGMPKLAKGSGDAVCDDAVLRAILAAKPFDLPGDDHPAERKRMLEQIRLKFRPRG